MKAIIKLNSKQINNYIAIKILHTGIELIKILNEEETKIKSKTVELLITEIEEKDENKISNLKSIIKSNEKIKIILLLSSNNINFIKKLSKMGIFGVISKITSLENQIQEISKQIIIIKKKNKEKRNHIRVKVGKEEYNKIKLKIAGITTIYQGKTINISYQGILIKLKETLSNNIIFKGKIVELEIQLNMYKIKSTGIVVSNSNKKIALRLSKLSKKSKTGIYKYIFSKMFGEKSSMV